MRWRISVFLIGVLSVAALIPIPYLAAPTWDVSVVTEEGKPMHGVVVRLSYENYSVENQGHEITLITDENGHAVFPAQLQKSCIARRTIYTLLSALGGVHASFGNYAYVIAWDSEGHSESADWRGYPTSMNSRIVLP